MGKTLFDKVWDAHVVDTVDNGPQILYIDKHLIHEVTSPQAFNELEERGIPVARPDQIVATADHNTPTENQHLPIKDEMSRKQLQQLKDTVVDLEDMAGGVSITDLTLNDFRMDLSDYMNQGRSPEQGKSQNMLKLEQAPLGLYSAVPLDDELKNDGINEGVIFCLKNIRSGKEAVQVDDNYPLSPYFLVYVSDEAVVELNFTQSKKVLDLIKRQAFIRSDVSLDATEAVNKRTKNGQNMEHYQHLLAVAVDSIAGKSEEKGVESLFTKGGTVLTATSSQGIEDFAVVSYLVLVEDGES